MSGVPLAYCSLPLKYEIPTPRYCSMTKLLQYITAFRCSCNTDQVTKMRRLTKTKA